MATRGDWGSGSFISCCFSGLVDNTATGVTGDDVKGGREVVPAGFTIEVYFSVGGARNVDPLYGLIGLICTVLGV